MNGKVALVQFPREITPAHPAALYEAAAAKYIKIDIASFRQLVRDGAIPARSHADRVRNIYLRDDLDDYLKSLPVKNMVNGDIVPFGRGRQTSTGE
jgi:hypothetical protein